MGTISEQLNQFKGLLAQARQNLDESKTQEAEKIVLDAIKIDEMAPEPYDFLEEIYLLKGNHQKANEYKQIAQAIRKKVWGNQVEAEIRGHHEMLGEASRHEIP